MIKQFVECGKYHYIESGSLLGIRTNVANILIPSEEHKLNMYPMDFEEFMDAMGESVLKEHIRRCFDERRAMGPDVHAKAMKLYRQPTNTVPAARRRGYGSDPLIRSMFASDTSCRFLL